VPLDIYDEQPESGDVADGTGRGRPYVSILFECCNVYARVYRNLGEQCYRGRCPKCLRTVQLRVGPDGTTSRVFRAR
jgi:hypothetical protein